jgi:hypothetical protein
MVHGNQHELLRRAREAGRAVGVRCPRGAVEPRAVRVVRIINGNGRKLVAARCRAPDRLPRDPADCAIERKIGEGGDAFRQVIGCAGGPVVPFRFVVGHVLELVRIKIIFRVRRARRPCRGKRQHAVHRSEIIGGGARADAEAGKLAVRAATVEGVARHVEGRRRRRRVIAGRREVPVAHEDRVAMKGIEHHEQPAAAVGKVHAMREAGLDGLAFAMLRRAETHPHFRPAIRLVSDEVHDTGNGVRSINRGRAVAQHLDARKAAHRQLVDVHGQGGDAGLTRYERRGRHAPAIEENQGVTGTHAAQTDVGVVAAGVGAAVARFITRHVGELRQPGQQLDRGKRIARLDGLAIQHCHRENLLGIQALDVGTRDPDSLEFHNFRRDGFIG